MPGRSQGQGQGQGGDGQGRVTNETLLAVLEERYKTLTDQAASSNRDETDFRREAREAIRTIVSDVRELKYGVQRLVERQDNVEKRVDQVDKHVTEVGADAVQKQSISIFWRVILGVFSAAGGVLVLLELAKVLGVRVGP